MSDELDGLDATEKAGFEAALNRCAASPLKLRANSVIRRPNISLTSWRWQTFVPSLSTLPDIPRTESPRVGRETPTPLVN